MTAATGMALAELRPVVAIYSTFLSRAFDQQNLDVGLHRAPVVICADRAGITGDDGASHHGLLDLVLGLSIPTLSVFAPSEPSEIAPMLEAALGLGTPALIRYPKTPGPLGLGEPGVGPRLPGAARGHGEVVLVGIGKMAERALAAASLLAAEGLDVTVLDPRVIRPLDPALLKRAGDASLVVTIEDGFVHGGAGQYIRSEIERGRGRERRRADVVNARHPDALPRTRQPRRDPRRPRARCAGHRDLDHCAARSSASPQRGAARAPTRDDRSLDRLADAEARSRRAPELDLGGGDGQGEARELSRRAGDLAAGAARAAARDLRLRPLRRRRRRRVRRGSRCGARLGRGRARPRARRRGGAHPVFVELDATIARVRRGARTVRRSHRRQPTRPDKDPLPDLRGPRRLLRALGQPGRAPRARRLRSHGRARGRRVLGPRSAPGCRSSSTCRTSARTTEPGVSISPPRTSRASVSPRPTSAPTTATARLRRLIAFECGQARHLLEAGSPLVRLLSGGRAWRSPASSVAASRSSTRSNGRRLRRARQHREGDEARGRSARAASFAPPAPMIALEIAYARCEEITRAEARNFSYGIRLLPLDKRQAMSALYAFARRVDDIGDGPLRGRGEARRARRGAPGDRRRSATTRRPTTRCSSRSPTRRTASRSRLRRSVSS